MFRTLLIVTLTLAAAPAVADKLAVVRPGGMEIIWTGRIVDMNPHDNGGLVHFSTEASSTTVQTERIFSDGMDAGRWHWWVESNIDPAQGYGACTATFDAGTVILDCGHVDP